MVLILPRRTIENLIVTVETLAVVEIVPILLERVVKRLTGDSGDIGCCGDSTDFT